MDSINKKDSNSRKKEYDTKKKREYSIKLNELYEKVIAEKKNKDDKK
jgi:hypothetical protein